MLLGTTPTLLADVEFGNDDYTKLLVHFDSMAYMNVAKGATTCRLLTPYNTQIMGTKKFGAGALRLNGTSSSFAVVKNSPDFDFGNGSFTVDWWQYATSWVNGSAIFRRQSDNTCQGFLLGHISTTLGNLVYMASNTSSWDIANAVSLGALPALNTWVHYAVVRNGNTFYTFMNGVQQATWTSSLSLMAAPANHAMYIGHWGGNGFNGYVDEIRISKGIARWTANFTPPTRAYGPTPDYSAWHTVGLYHFNNITNAGGTAFVDSSPYAYPATGGNGYGHPYNAFVGGGQGSSYFNAGNYYNVLNGGWDLDFGNGDFTIDWWDWRSDTTDGRSAMVRTTVTLTYQPFLIGYASGGTLYCYCSNDNANWNILGNFSLGTFAVNEWSHRAIVRKNGVFYGFKNGVLQSTNANANSALTIQARGNEQMFVGVWNYEGGQYWAYGLMDELRISKGIGRWTTNFTPPTLPYN